MRRRTPPFPQGYAVRPGTDGKRAGAVRSASLVLFVVVLALAGCTTGSATAPPPGGSATEHATTRSATGSATGPTARPTPSTSASFTYPSDVPAAAQADTTAGAIAFTRYVVNRINTAYTSGQPGLIRAVSTARCARCASFEATIAELASRSRHTVSAPMRVKDVSPGREAHLAGQTVVDVLYQMQAVKIVDAAGTTTGTVSPEQGIYVVALIRDGSVWKIDQIDLLQ